MREVNPETITSALSWYKILPLNGFHLIRANQNLHMRRKKLINILGAVANTENCIHRQLDGIWESVWKFFMESPHFNTSSFRDKWHRWKSRSTNKRKMRQQYGYNQDWMKRWSQTPWNAIVICEMSKTSWQMGKRHTKDEMEQHDILIADLEHQILMLEESTQKNYWSDKKMMISSSPKQMVQQNCQEETTNSEYSL